MSAVSKNYAFISYSSDNQQEAEALRVYFAEQGIACWMAPYDIPAGSSYAAEIVDAIKHSGCLVLLLTSASQGSQHVRRELEIAVSAQIPIIPMQLEDINLSSEFQYYLGTQQIVAVPAIDASSPSFVKAVKGVQHFLTVKPESPKMEVREPKPPFSEPSVTERSLWKRLCQQKWLLPCAAAALLVCLLVVWMISGRTSPPEPQAETKAELTASETVEETAAFEETVMDAENLGHEMEGEETRQDSGTALEWYQKAAELGDAEAMFRIGEAFYYGNGVEQNYNTAMEWFLKAAENGYSGAIVWVGYLYAQGRGVEQDYQTALEWYLKASEAGSASAMYYIGNLYKMGNAVEQNYNTALEWYQKGAELGNTLCMVGIGNFYATGKGVEKNVETALQWYLKAAELGDVYGMGNTGWAYAYGLGENADYGKAMEWYQKAADTGDAGAMKQIGALYEYGRGVEQDYKAALSWYQKAADLGNADAMRAIARLKENGHA